MQQPWARTIAAELGDSILDVENKLGKSYMEIEQRR